MDEEQNVSSNDEQGHREDILEKLREHEAENQKQKETGFLQTIDVVWLLELNIPGYFNWIQEFKK